MITVFITGEGSRALYFQKENNSSDRMGYEIVLDRMTSGLPLLIHGYIMRLIVRGSFLPPALAGRRILRLLTRRSVQDAALTVIKIS